MTITSREQKAAPTGEGRAAVNDSYRWLVLIVAGTSAFMGALDGSIINIIIPQIQAQYQATLGDISWVSTAYLVTISSLLLSAGRLGDMWGYRPVFGAGFIVFGLGSLLCGLAPTLPTLIGGRLVQGVGAAVMMALSPALITTTFPGRERGRALGMQATLTFTGLTLGPSLGGFIAGQWGWHWVFLINLPVAAVGAVLAYTQLRPTERRSGQAFDFAGALLFAAGLASVLLALSQAETWGWGDGRTRLFLVGGVLLLLLFVWQERRAAQPMLPLWMFREPAFTSGIAASFLQFSATFVLTFLLPFYLQQYRGLSPGAAGAVMTAQPIAMVSVAGLAGWLSDRIGTRIPATLGMSTIAAGLFLVASSGPGTPVARVALCLAVIGLGAGLFSAPNNSSIMGSAPGTGRGWRPPCWPRPATWAWSRASPSPAPCSPT
ncbi:MFS transporter [Symbiobacterium thermophilum]|uniref:MFS transporter n=1 Tax=Symbiobacterium thermophilum TaxID=2734 RepID=UPI0035C6BD5F